MLYERHSWNKINCLFGVTEGYLYNLTIVSSLCSMFSRILADLRLLSFEKGKVLA